jgi:carbon-monoxide dehydrogenase small subunit
MAASALLSRKADPTRQEIQEALAGQLCRCTGYQQIYEAVESGARVLRGQQPLPPTLSAVVQGGGHG